jgi:hypothetical protein
MPNVMTKAGSRYPRILEKLKDWVFEFILLYLPVVHARTVG